MLIPQLNRTGYEQVFGAFTNGEGATIPVDAVCQMKVGSSADGISIVQPNSNETNAVIGIADKAISDTAIGLVQLYGYRATSQVQTTDTTIAAGVRLLPSAGADKLVSSASGDLLFVLLESATTGSATVSKKILIRAM